MTVLIDERDVRHMSVTCNAKTWIFRGLLSPSIIYIPVYIYGSKWTISYPV